MLHHPNMLDFSFGPNNQLYENVTDFSIRMGKPTGEVAEENPQYIEVEVSRGIIVYARPCYSFPIISAPSKEWLTKNKNNIVVWIAHSYGSPNATMWLGFTYVDGKAPDMDFPRDALFTFEKFDMFFKNSSNYSGIRQYNEDGSTNQEIAIKEDKTFIQSKSVNLGSENSAESALLGDTSADIIDKLFSLLEQMTFTNGAGITTPPNNLAAIQALHQRVESMKSKVVKLD